MALSSSQLEAFSTVAQHLSFSRAAEALHVTQSALSQRILNLEEELGTALFLRDRTGAQLTETGRALLRYVQMKDALETEFLQTLTSPSSTQLGGVIRIGSYSSVSRSVVVPALSELVRENPKVRLSFMIRELEDLPALLRRGEVDYVILDKDLQRSDLISIVLGEEEGVLVEPKSSTASSHIFLDHDERDMTTERFLQLQSREALDKLIGEKKKPSAIERRYADDVYCLLDGVRQGLGRAVVSRHLVGNQKDIVVRKGLKPLRTPVVLHHFQRPYYSALHEAVIASLKKYAPGYLR